jgi:hypothetical protein
VFFCDAGEVFVAGGEGGEAHRQECLCHKEEARLKPGLYKGRESEERFLASLEMTVGGGAD